MVLVRMCNMDPRRSIQKRRVRNGVPRYVHDQGYGRRGLAGQSSVDIWPRPCSQPGIVDSGGRRCSSMVACSASNA